MTKEQAMKYYRTQAAIAAVCNVSPRAVSLWKEQPPAEPQMRMHKDSGGKLKADISVLKFYRDLTEGVL